MANRFQAPRGTQDILPDIQPYWAAVQSAIAEVTRLYGFRRIDTPAFESAALFEKGSGDTTDIVEKEMYTFEDRGGDQLALTPEGTPAICRAYLEHGMASWPQPVRLYTTHQMFRYDRPQKGRYRQHTQFDCEVFGSTNPLVDAEAISVLWMLYQQLGLHGLQVRIASLDDPEPRKAYLERLREYYVPLRNKLSEDSQRRLDRNALRLLDSKDERDLPFKEAAPKLVHQLSPDAEAHHQAVIQALTGAGIPTVVDPFLVRGLDYYNRTVFEIVPVDDERAQGTIGAGGRYDHLMATLGGPPTPAIGFGTGIERIVLEMQRCGVVFEDARGAEVFVVHRGEGSGRVAFRIATDLRRERVPTQVGDGTRSFKAQLRSADNSGARVALIIGESELERGVVVVKNLRAGGEQREAPLDAVVAMIRGAAPGE